VRVVSMLLFLSAAACVCAAAEAPFDGVRDYAHGQTRAPLLAVESTIRAAGGDAEALARVEQRLLDTLSADCSPAGMQFCCEQLAFIGTARSVPALAALLQQPDTAAMARYALEEIPAPEAREVLAEALATAAGADRVALVNALGARGDAAESIPVLTPLLADGDTAVALAAAHALSRTGAPAALDALVAAWAGPASGRDGALARACLDGADLLAATDAAAARAVFERLFWALPGGPLRETALRGYIATAGDFSMTIVLELLWGNVPGMEDLAIPFVRELPGGTQAAAHLGNMTPAVQAKVIDALADRDDPSVLPAILTCFGRPEFSGEAVLNAAARAVGLIGGAAEVDALTAVGATHETVRETAVTALATLRGADVNAALLAALLDAEEPTGAIMLTRALSMRHAVETAPALVARAAEAEGAVQTALLEALVVLAGPAEAPALAELTTRLWGEARTLAGEATVAACRGGAGPVVAAWEACALPEGRRFLVGLLPRIGDDAVVDRVGDWAADSDDALAALAAWPTGAAVPRLGEVFTESAGERRATALAGAMRGLAQPTDRDAESTLALLAGMLAAAETEAEYAAIFGALARVGDARALDVLAPYLEGHGVDAAARDARVAVTRGLYRASASHKTGTAALAIDGIAETRWDTGAPQLGAEWFQVDLGLVSPVRGVTVDTSASPEGYPGKAALYLSLDGKNWGAPVAEQAGAAELRFTFPAREARYVRVCQTGRRETQLWSVHELVIDTDPTTEE